MDQIKYYQKWSMDRTLGNAAVGEGYVLSSLQQNIFIIYYFFIESGRTINKKCLSRFKIGVQGCTSKKGCLKVLDLGLNLKFECQVKVQGVKFWVPIKSQFRDWWHSQLNIKMNVWTCQVTEINVSQKSP